MKGEGNCELYFDTSSLCRQTTAVTLIDSEEKRPSNTLRLLTQQFLTRCSTSTKTADYCKIRKPDLVQKKSGSNFKHTFLKSLAIGRGM